jgi:hypothetical protein
MGLVTKPLDLTQDLIPSAAQWESLFDILYNLVNGNIDDANVDKTAIGTLATANTWTALQIFSGSISSELAVLSTANAAGSVTDILSLEWNPGDGGQMSDNSSGVALRFVMPDSGDVQTDFAAIVGMSVSDTAGSEEGGLSFLAVKAGTSNTELMTLEPTTGLVLGVDDTGYDLKLFGASAGAFTEWDESADTFKVQGASAAGPGILQLATGELTNVDGGIIGRLEFIAPLDSAGTDAILVAASIWAEADATFSASVNDTDLVFAVATSEVAAAVMRLDNAGLYPSTDDGLSLGLLNTNDWSDIFLATGATINYENGDVVLTHTAGVLNVSTGALQVGGVAVTTGGAALTGSTNNTITTVTGANAIVGEANLTFDGSALQVTGTLTVGVDGTGYDVTQYSEAAGAFSLWDDSANLLELRGATAAGPGHLKLTTGETSTVDGDILGRIDFQAPVDASGTDAILVGASIWAEADATFSSSVNTTDLIFATGDSEAAAEKMRLDSTGWLGLGVVPTVPFEILSSNANYIWRVLNSSSTPYGLYFQFSGAAPDDNSKTFQVFADTSTTRARLYSDGDWQNHDDFYGAISDRRYKQGIINPPSYWEDFKAVQFRKFKLNDDVEQYGRDAKYHLGVIADEIEPIFPGLVKYHPNQNDNNEMYAGFNYSTFAQIGCTVIQELQLRVEALEAA